MSSIKLYNAAAKVIDRAMKKEASVKHLCFDSKFRNKKLLFALVVETLKYRKLLTLVHEECSSIWKDENMPSATVCILLLYETLLGKGATEQLQHHHTVLQENRNIIFDAWQAKCAKYPHLLPAKTSDKPFIPRYVRINTLKVASSEAIRKIENEGYQLVQTEDFSTLSSQQFCMDTVVPDLLVFHPSTEFHDSQMYREGELLLQDKASCLPAFILNPPEHSYIVDACAAPGNKSSHLAAITNNNSTIVSFDLDKDRLKVMQKLIRLSSSSSVTCKLQDFLKARHTDAEYGRAEYILLDPSCSGSGIVSRLDHLVDEEQNTSKSRLLGLSKFQTAVLSHALGFSNVKKVIYSTCSINQEENEDVVEKAMNRFKESFSLCHILPEWKNRGTGVWDQAYKCIRAIPSSDHTNGFFVALFERIPSSETDKNCLRGENTSTENSVKKPTGKSTDSSNSKLEHKKENTQKRKVHAKKSQNGEKSTKEQSERGRDLEKTKTIKRKMENDKQSIVEPFSMKKKKKKGGVKKPVT